jgi:hypothetical protein
MPHVTVHERTSHSWHIASSFQYMALYGCCNFLRYCAPAAKADFTRTTTTVLPDTDAPVVTDTVNEGDLPLETSLTPRATMGFLNLAWYSGDWAMYLSCRAASAAVLFCPTVMMSSSSDTRTGEGHRSTRSFWIVEGALIFGVALASVVDGFAPLAPLVHSQALHPCTEAPFSSQKPLLFEGRRPSSLAFPALSCLFLLSVTPFSSESH